jgi:hypothetical protein
MCSEKAQRRAGLLQPLLQHPTTTDQLDAAQVLSLEPDEIESVHRRSPGRRQRGADESAADPRGRTALARIGWHGTMKPGGSWRFGRTQRGGVRINMARCREQAGVLALDLAPQDAYPFYRFRKPAYCFGVVA